MLTDSKGSQYVVKAVQGTQQSTMVQKVENKVELYEKLKGRFSDEDIRALCFHLEEIEYENLPGETIDRKVRELIDYYYRRRKLAMLKGKIGELRPDIFE